MQSGEIRCGVGQSYFNLHSKNPLLMIINKGFLVNYELVCVVATKEIFK